MDTAPWCLISEDPAGTEGGPGQAFSLPVNHFGGDNIFMDADFLLRGAFGLPQMEELACTN